MTVPTALIYPPESTLAALSRYQLQAPVDVVRIAEDHFGIAVWRQQLEPGVSGKLMRDPENGGPSGFSILVADDEPHVRQRFTIAHEIAHFVLHRQAVDRMGGEVQDDVFYRSGMNTAQEAEANRYAADLLMPSALINNLIILGITQVDVLAKRLGVSEAALKIRLGIPVA